MMLTLNEWAIRYREVLIENPYLLGYLSENYTSDEIVIYTQAQLEVTLHSIGYTHYALNVAFSDLRTAIRETKIGDALMNIAELLGKVSR